jgi:hypothetical protein
LGVLKDSLGICMPRKYLCRRDLQTCAIRTVLLRRGADVVCEVLERGAVFLGGHVGCSATQGFAGGLFRSAPNNYGTFVYGTRTILPWAPEGFITSM